jgi:hypothetical protein
MVYRLASVAFKDYQSMFAPDESRVRLPVPEDMYFCIFFDVGVVPKLWVVQVGVGHDLGKLLFLRAERNEAINKLQQHPTSILATILAIVSSC